MSILEAILDANQLIAAAETGDAYNLYECLHQIARRIASADAFYICLYEQDDQSLFFPYNYDNGVYDPPSTFPLGDGPTSMAIRRNAAVVWNTEQEARQTSGVHFGDLDSFTLSAVHVPIRNPKAGSNNPLIGVLSAHSYLPDAYGCLEVKAYQWLADRAAEALARTQVNQRETEQQRQVSWITDQCVQMIDSICTDAQAVQTLARPDNASLQDALFALIRSCHRHQTDVNQLPLRFKELSRIESTLSIPLSCDSLSAVTVREREILRLLATGHTYDEISQNLFITSNTVKDHLKRIYNKLGVHNRHEAAHLYKSAS